ncbi:hypothetical protein [Stenomitos frigidus]|uniref:hypothetical protein n=1 Tax=Stenomitos frigidus TaxID=1886765 RepID=UPI0015E6DBD7|nr:hypothetical protein [Stenomitos frigidus]
MRPYRGNLCLLSNEITIAVRMVDRAVAIGGQRNRVSGCNLGSQTTRVKKPGFWQTTGQS